MSTQTQTPSPLNSGQPRPSWSRRYGAAPVTQRIQCPELRLHDDAAVRQLYREFREHILALSLGIDLPEALVRIETFVLHGSVPTHQPLQPAFCGSP